MGTKLSYMKYFFILFLAIVSCKENKQPEKHETTVEQEIVESNIPFYDLILKYETEQKLFNKLPLDTSKYFKTYVLQGESKMIQREFEDIKPSNILNEAELDKLNYHIVFEDYEWDFSIDRSKFNVDFIERFKFNDRKSKTNKTEVVYFFTYPLSVSKNKVLIGFEIKHKTYPKESSKGVYMGFFIFEKIDDKWNITAQESLLEH